MFGAFHIANDITWDSLSTIKQIKVILLMKNKIYGMLDVWNALILPEVFRGGFCLVFQWFFHLHPLSRQLQSFQRLSARKIFAEEKNAKLYYVAC